MQQADDDESQKSTARLKKTVECLLDLSKHGAQLKPVALGYFIFDDMESKYHSFTGEVAADWSAIGQN